MGTWAATTLVLFSFCVVKVDGECLGSECGAGDNFETDGLAPSLLQHQHQLNPFATGAHNSVNCPSGYKHIKYASQCEKGAQVMQEEYQGVLGYTSYPQGCVQQSSTNAFWFNDVEGDGSGSSSYVVVCQSPDEASSEEHAPFARSGKNLDRCPEGYEGVENPGECQEASNSLSLSYVGTTSSSSYPAGCFGSPSPHGADNVWFNSAGDGKASSSKYVLCKASIESGHGDDDNDNHGHKISGHLRTKNMDSDECIHPKHHTSGQATCSSSKKVWIYDMKKSLFQSAEDVCLHAKNGDVVGKECDKHDDHFQWNFGDCDKSKGKCVGSIKTKRTPVKCLTFKKDKFKLKNCQGSNKDQQFVLKA